MSEIGKTETDILNVEGGHPLEGEVFVRGAKNTLPKNMVAALLTPDTCTINNVARIVDVDIVRDMIIAFGGNVKFTGGHSVQIDTQTLTQAPLEQMEAFSGRSRIPILTCGPMLARTGHVIVPALGGCQIGDCPIDFHIEALKALGARVEAHETHIEMFADRLHGTKIRLPYPSVGATEQVLLASVLADGVTELNNAAIEPEIMDLIAVLQKMGAIISVDTHRVITIHGVEKLSGFKHKALPDRLEAASWACLAAATNGWIFSGWPIPLKIKEARAAITHQRTPSEISTSSPVSISVALNYPDDLIYDGSSGSVGLTLEPLLKMKWWGIAVYTETDNFVSECVPTTSPLPTAVFNLGAGDYKTSLSLAETKADCEIFSQNEYPLFAALEAANFTAK